MLAEIHFLPIGYLAAALTPYFKKTCIFGKNYYYEFS